MNKHIQSEPSPKLSTPELIEAALTDDEIDNAVTRWASEVSGKSRESRRNAARKKGEDRLAHAVLLREYIDAHTSGAGSVDEFDDLMSARRQFSGLQGTSLISKSPRPLESDKFYGSLKHLVEQEPDTTGRIAEVLEDAPMNMRTQIRVGMYHDWGVARSMDGPHTGLGERLASYMGMVRSLAQDDSDPARTAMTEVLSGPNWQNQAPPELAILEAATTINPLDHAKIRTIENILPTISQGDVTLIREYYETIPINPTESDASAQSMAKTVTTLFMRNLEATATFDSNAKIMAQYLASEADTASRSRGIYKTPFSSKCPPMAAFNALANKLGPSLAAIDGVERPHIDKIGDDRSFVIAIDILTEALDYANANAEIAFSDKKRISTTLECMQLINGRLDEALHSLRVTHPAPETADSGTVRSIKGRKSAYYNRRKPGYGKIS